MADIVNTGATANDGSGDDLRTSFQLINQRFQQLLGTLSQITWAPGLAISATPLRQWTVVAGQAYVAASNHIAGATFAADLAAGRWLAADVAQAMANLSAFQAKLASNGLGDGAELVGADDGASGARFSNVQLAINDLLGGVTGIAVNVAAFPYLAKCDGVTDDTAAVNAAVLYLAQQGGGRLMWPTGKTCKLLGKVWVVSNVQYDLNGSKLIGGGVATGVMFETAYLNAGALVTNVGTAYQSHGIKNAKIHGGQVTDVGKLFNFQNFNQGCRVQEIELFNARQLGVFDACFCAHFDKLMHSGGTINTLPSFHFKRANNAIVLNGVVTTCEWDYFFEGGGAGVTMVGCTQEGGTKGIKINGELLGFVVVGNYVEAIPGTWLDLTEATYISYDVSGSYFNYVDVIVDDGAPTHDCLINGKWHASNEIINVNGQIEGVGPVYRALMRIGGRLNYAEYSTRNDNDASVDLPPNWIIGKATNVSKISSWLGSGVTDFRKRAAVHGGIIPLRFSGDTGDTYPESVPFCVVTIGATTHIDTKIKWRPNSLFAKFSFRAQDGNGFHELYGDIYGSLFKRHDADPMVMAISDNGGFLRISLTQTAAPFSAVTGTVQICS